MKDKKRIVYAKTKEITEMGLLDTGMGVALGLYPSENSLWFLQDLSMSL